MSMRRRFQRSRGGGGHRAHEPARPAALSAADHFYNGLTRLKLGQLETIRADNHRAMAEHDAQRCACTFHARQEGEDWPTFEPCETCEPRWQLAVLLESLIAFARRHPEAAGTCDCCGDPLPPRGPLGPPEALARALSELPPP